MFIAGLGANFEYDLKKIIALYYPYFIDVVYALD